MVVISSSEVLDMLKFISMLSLNSMLTCIFYLLFFLLVPSYLFFLCFISKTFFT